MPEITFRKEALERLSSPDQLDERVTLAPIRGWLVLLGLTIFLSSVGIWAFFSQIPVKVSATGVLLLKGPIFEVNAPGSAYLVEWKVSEGDEVKKGQILAVLNDPELEEQVRLDTLALDEIRSHYQAWRNIQKKADKRWRQTMLRQSTRLRSLNNSSGQLDKSSAADLVDYEMELTAIELNRIEQDGAKRVAKLDREWAIQELQRRVAFLKLKLSAITNLRAYDDGLVIQIQAFPPARIEMGQPLVLLSPKGDLKKDLLGYAFVDSMQSSSIVSGQQVEISVAGVKIEETGLLMGKVRGVSPLSLSESAIQSIIHIPGFAKKITDEVGFAPHLVTIDLEPDSTSPTGYYWTGFDPKRPIAPGEAFYASIHVDESHPIDYVVPIFERIL